MLDQPVGLLERMMAAVTAYDACQAWSKQRTSAVKNWKENNQAYWNMLEIIWAMDKENGTE